MSEDIKTVSEETVALVRLVVKDAAAHTFSVSRVYAAYNAVFGKNETPQSCASCLRTRAHALGQWLDEHDKVDAAKSDASDELKAAPEAAAPEAAAPEVAAPEVAAPEVAAPEAAAPEAAAPEAAAPEAAAPAAAAVPEFVELLSKNGKLFRVNTITNAIEYASNGVTPKDGKIELINGTVLIVKDGIAEEDLS